LINEQFYKYNFGGDYLLVNLVMNTMKVNQIMSQMVILRRNLIQMKITTGVIALILMKITIGVIALILTKNMTGVKNMIMMRKQHLIVMMMGKLHLIIMTMMIKMMIKTIIITQIKEGAELLQLCYLLKPIQ